MSINMIGNQYGRLKVIKQVESSKRGLMFECLCECGNTKVCAGKDLRRLNYKSCGCLHHRMSTSRIYEVWCNMKRRCNDSKNNSYKRYGGRGITYDPRWEDFLNFYEDMKEGYSDALTLDRIDAEGNYSKDNCRWADRLTQANNTSSNRLITYKGETLNVAQMARKHNFNAALVINRLHRTNMTVEEAIENPVERETIVYKGVEKTVVEYAKEYGMTYHQLKKRLMRDWSIEKALTQPLRKKAT